MNFWQNLLAASSLTSGNVWELSSNPKTGGGGNIVNNGAIAVINDTVISTIIENCIISTTLITAPIQVTISNTSTIAQVQDSTTKVVVILESN